MFPASSRAIPLDNVEALRAALEGYFSLTDTTLDYPEVGQVRFRGYFVCDPADCYDELRRRFEAVGYTPMVRPAEHGVMVVALPTVFDPPASNWWINLGLFVATVLSTLYVGAHYEPGFTGVEIWLGWPFSLSMLTILGAHELGHYFAARYHKVPVSLPYFIPLPYPPLIGTMGAFIRLKAPIKNRRALLDIGVAGPLAGLVFAIPILIIGLLTSSLQPPPPGGYILEGNSILYMLAKYTVFGQCLPAQGDFCQMLSGFMGGGEAAAAMDVTLNQVAWAGWVGLFVTGLNLIPVGQLDGGHIAYVLFGSKARRFFWPAIATLVLLGLVTGTATWWLWIFLLFFFGRYHAEPLDDVTVLDGRRRAVAWFTLLLFFLVFVPAPLQIVGLQ